MGIIFKDKVCVVTGALKTLSRAEAHAKLRAAGAIVSTSVSSRTDYLIAGGTLGGSKYDVATLHGVIVLNEEQLLAALEGRAEEAEALASPPEEIAPVALNEALRELRELLYDTPDRKVWGRICELLDACPDDVLPIAVDYVNGLVDGWSGDLHFGVQAYGYKLWGDASDVRVLPDAWLIQLAQGQDSPRFSVPRILNAHNAKLTGKTALKLLGSSHLTNLRYLALGSNKLSGAFFKALRQTPQLASLTHLDLGSLEINTSIAQAWTGPTALTRLTHLSLNSARVDTEESLRALLAAEDWRQLEVLNLNCLRLKQGPSRSGSALLAFEPSLSLRTLLMEHIPGDPGALERFLQNPRLQNLEHLSLHGHRDSAADLASLAAHDHLCKLRKLILSDCYMGDAAAAAILGAPHLGALEQLNLSNSLLGPESALAFHQAAHLALLHTLTLHDTHFSPDDARRFAEAPLPALHDLKIGFRDPASADTFALALAAAPRFPKLRKLYLWNDLSDATLLRLVQAPHLAALTSFGTGRRAWDPDFKARLLEASAFSSTLRAQLQKQLSVQT